jgi:hypothetical protein
MGTQSPDQIANSLIADANSTNNNGSPSGSGNTGYQVFTGQSSKTTKLKGRGGRGGSTTPQTWSDKFQSQQDYENGFYAMWNDPGQRNKFLNLALGGSSTGNHKSFNADIAQKIWNQAGYYSAKLADTGGPKMTPWQVLAFYSTNGNVSSSGSGSGSRSSGGGGGGGGGGGAGSSYTQTSTGYDISDPETAKALTNNVMQAAMGRQATAEELTQYRNALNAAEKSHPQTTTTHVNGMSSSSTRSGGIDKQQVLTDKVTGTAESQAYTTSTLLNDAMQYLAGGSPGV